MQILSIHGSAQPNDEEAAAISAAVTTVLQAETTQPPYELPISPWEDSGKLVQQGLNPSRTGVRPSWQTIERLRQRAAGGFTGIVGL